MPQKSTHWSGGSEPHIRLPNLGVLQREEEFLENQTLTLEEIDCMTSTGLGETETPLLEGTHKVVCASGPRGRSSDPGETEPDLSASVGGSPAEAGGGSVSPWGQGHWQQKFWEVLLGVSPPRVCHYPHQRAQVGSSVGLPQAKQPTGREPSPTHQQSSGLKFY